MVQKQGHLLPESRTPSQSTLQMDVKEPSADSQDMFCPLGTSNMLFYLSATLNKATKHQRDRGRPSEVLIQYNRAHANSSVPASVSEDVLLFEKCELRADELALVSFFVLYFAWVWMTNILTLTLRMKLAFKKSTCSL